MPEGGAVQALAATPLVPICRLIYLQQLKGPMPIALWIASAIEFGISNYTDGSILLGIQFANATIAWYETTKAGDAVAALKASLKPVATVKRDGAWKNIDATELVPGDLILIGSGAAIPADSYVHGCVGCSSCRWLGAPRPVAAGLPSVPCLTDALPPPPFPLAAASRTVDVDQAALTGESLPVTMNHGDVAKMGSTCVRGESEGRRDAW